MSASHAASPAVGTALVRRLVAAQFPAWAHLPVRAVDSAGTDNAMFRLGDDLAVRLPKASGPRGRPRRSGTGCRASPRT